MKPNHQLRDEDTFFMKKALEVAYEGLKCGEVPVGCVVVHDNEILCSSHNNTNKHSCALRHAEIECFQLIYKKYGSLDILKECKLYVTCEPCCFCTTALIYVGIKEVCFGCSNPRFGGCGSVCAIEGVFDYKRGLLKEECISVLKKFYDQNNPRTRK